MADRTGSLHGLGWCGSPCGLWRTLLWWYYVRGAVILTCTRLFYADVSRLRLPVGATALAACALVACGRLFVAKAESGGCRPVGAILRRQPDTRCPMVSTPQLHAARRIARLGFRSRRRHVPGDWSHELSLENLALPIWTPWNRAFPLNAWFDHEASRLAS